jgi:hypothetical protein
MKDEHEDQKSEWAARHRFDEDPPTEAEFLRQLNESREPADDDPPVESRSPWDEVQPGGGPSASTASSPEDDPPRTPGP